ncbi:DUF4376 domain-containing protein, partial [Neisseria sp. P0020.S003]|uniref:DUF4376 domain-containing protein n=1 Tax=Neisseria sp. P0020.S003 TaxID=3436808 RepID=UPI003F7D5DC2
MSENQYPPTKPVCQLNADNLYLHQTVADLDPLAEDGSYLLPAGCIDAEPPETRAGFAARWLPERAEWQYLPDHRGKTAYQSSDGTAVVIEQVGELPAGLTLLPRENEYQTWDDKAKAWVLLPAVAVQIKEQQQDEMWKRIKDKRYDNLRHGVFVKSVGKWFHTNDESRTQYILLRTMKELPVGLRWKTMENDFVLMTRELLDEMTTQMVLDEQADFANAERHKAAMLKAENPLEYDYSDGWTANYE